MFERISDGFYALDDDWRFTYANDRAEELIDYRGEGLVGKDFWEVFERAEESTLGEKYREAFETQAPTSFEFYHPDPLDAWYEVHAYPSETGLSVYFRDVTERRERKQALRESKEQLRALIEVLPVAVVVAEDDGRIVEWNEAAEEIWGGQIAESDSIVDHDGRWADTGEPVDPDEWPLARALRGEEVTDPDEIEIEGSDGERRTVLNHGMPVRDADGEVSRAVVTLIDITEQKERERELDETIAELQESEERLRLALKAGEMGTWELDLQTGDAPVRSPRHDRIFGYEEPLDDWDFETFLDHVHPDDRERVEQRFEAAFETGKWSFECRIVGADDEQRAISAQGEFYYDSEGEPVRAVGIVQDVTERKERKRELEQVERQFEAAFNNPSAFMGLLDPDGTVRRINETALEFAGVDETDVRGEKFWETPWFTHSEEVREELRAGLERAADGEYVRSEFSHRSPDGETVIIDAMLEPVRDEDGEVVAIMPSGNDITERKRHEERLEQQNERLESFASILAHELRNPVTIGQIYSQRLPAETDGEAVDYVTEAFDRIEDIIDVMLMLTRGRDAVGDSSPVELATVAREAWDEIDAPDAALDVELDRTIRAEKTYTRHLLRNLLENAVEHGGPDVTVTVGGLPDASASSENRSPSDRSSGRGSREGGASGGSEDEQVGSSGGFYVADDGVGIPAEDRDAIFDQGYTTAADSGGSGLGLAFVRKFADVYGWDLAVTESEGGGARFEFRNIG